MVFDCATSGPRRHTFAGPLLREVVAATLPRFAPLRREERSRFLLAVSGGVGHHTVMSGAEIDADFGNAPVLLATRMDDQDLDEAGAQLVVPSDRCGARYVSAVTGIWLGRHAHDGVLPVGVWTRARASDVGCSGPHETMTGDSGDGDPRKPV